MFKRAIPLMLVALLAGCGEKRAQDRSSQQALPAHQPVDSPAPPPGAPLARGDFVVAGLRRGMDSIAVRRLLGTPDSVAEQEDFRDVGAKLVSWHYRNLIVLLGSYNSLGGVWITGPGVATARGLQVGDPESRVRALYGEPTFTYGPAWQYDDPSDPEGLEVITIEFRHGFVDRIYIGHVYD